MPTGILPGVIATSATLPDLPPKCGYGPGGGSGGDCGRQLLRGLARAAILNAVGRVRFGGVVRRTDARPSARSVRGRCLRRCRPRARTGDGTRPHRVQPSFARACRLFARIEHTGPSFGRRSSWSFRAGLQHKFGRLSRMPVPVHGVGRGRWQRSGCRRASDLAFATPWQRPCPGRCDSGLLFPGSSGSRDSLVPWRRSIRTCRAFSAEK